MAMPLDKLIETLHKSGCSLVLEDKQGNIRLFFKKGVRDLEDLLDHEPETLSGATIADKVIGKAAAGMIAYGGASEVYAEAMSRKALPLLEDNNVRYSYGQVVDHIVIPQGDTRCPLEEIVAPATTAEEAVRLLRQHFMEMQKQRSQAQATAYNKSKSQGSDTARQS